MSARFFLLSFLALAALRFAPALAEEAPAVPPADEPTHTLTIAYSETSGDLRRAEITLKPMHEDVPPLWTGDLAQISVLSKEGHWIHIDEFLSSGHSSGAVARAMLPAPESVLIIIARSERGRGAAFRASGRAGDWTRMTWTRYDQNGDAGPTAEASPSDCDGVVDPWTRECYPDGAVSGIDRDRSSLTMGIVAEGGGNGI